MVLDEDESTAKYACDSCKSSKVTCSRERSGCQRCKKINAECTYSRSGVIRRGRKRKNETPDSPSSSSRASVKHTSIAADSNSDVTGLPCLLTDDIEDTRQRLSGLDTPEQHSSLNALSSLSEACRATTIGHDVSSLDKVDGAFFLPKEYAVEWAQVFEPFLAGGGSLMCTAPPEVLDHLRAARPHLVRERAWLVMYYTVILNTVTSSSLKEKLGRSLWLALSDVRVLLEPSEANIQALVLVLSRASELTGPSLCWMLATSACRMLQALGVNHRRLDGHTRERRLVRFWHLNLLDKGLAIIFGRTPTFHRQMVKEIGLPKLEQIQPFMPHSTSSGAPGFFGAHFMYQKILLSHLMDDIWNCLYGGEGANERSIQDAGKDLELWYEQSKRILEAAALSEQPFCDAKNAHSINIALHTVDFHFFYLNILLTRPLPQKREQHLDTSKRMLHLLQHMAPESKEPYHPVIWQLVCCPFTPFLILFRDMLSSHNRGSEERKEALAAMEQLPKYLKDMSPRSSLAANLEGIAKVIVQHARSVVCRADFARPHAGASPVTRGSKSSMGSLPDSWPSEVDMSHSEFLLDNNVLMPSTVWSESGDFSTGLDDDLTMFLHNVDGNGIFDWLTWESQSQDMSLHQSNKTVGE